MPTAKPRITVTLEPRAHEVLTRLSAAGGESMSSLITQLLYAALPSLERVVVVLERAQTAPKEALAGLTAAVERAERHLMPLIMDAQGMGDLFLDDMAATVEPGRSAVPAPKERARPAGRASSKKPKGDPRLVTRGSGSPQRAGKGVKRG